MVDIWFQDEARVGQQGSQTRIWAPKGTRPRLVKQQQFISSYIYGAVCPKQRECAALVLPFANYQGLELHLKEIAFHIPTKRHAVVVLDQAGYHKAKDINIPDNITLLSLPPYSPELNPQEQVWRHLKDRVLSNRVFENSKSIVDACTKAWNAFAKDKEKIFSLTYRSWADIVP